MALVDITATQGDNLLEPEEIQDAVTDDLQYRDQQLLRLKDEILDLEDFNENVALSEFTLDDFRLELIKYLETNRKQLEDAAPGLYTVVPPPPDSSIIAPGVIFCLKQKEEVNGKRGNKPDPPLLSDLYSGGWSS